MLYVASYMLYPYAKIVNTKIPVKRTIMIKTKKVGFRVVFYDVFLCLQ